MRELSADWQKILAEGFATSADLLRYLQLPETLAMAGAEQPFRTRVPRGFAALMEPGNPQDPLLLQVLASPNEMVTSNFVTDPLQERSTNPVPGLLHKYPSRVLLTLTGACAIHCRYCFRRHFPYEDNNPGREGWFQAFEYIKQHPEVFEVILSGGDPLVAKDNHIAWILEQLAAITHVSIVRFHTRVPIVLPERVNASLLEIFRRSPLRKVMVLHCNHPNELDIRAEAVCGTLQKAGFHLLNQSVILAGVNQTADILARLSQRLFTCGVQPYYLHVLDKVQGAAHFDLPLVEVKKIYQELQGLLPGYLVPKLATEVPGEAHKILL